MRPGELRAVIAPYSEGASMQRVTLTFEIEDDLILDAAGTGQLHQFLSNVVQTASLIEVSYTPKGFKFPHGFTVTPE